jgi:hypothetical protein
VQKINENSEPKTWEDVEYDEDEWFMNLQETPAESDLEKEAAPKIVEPPDSDDDEDEEEFDDPLGIRFDR